MTDRMTSLGDEMDLLRLMEEEHRRAMGEALKEGVAFSTTRPEGPDFEIAYGYRLHMWLSRVFKKES